MTMNDDGQTTEDGISVYRDYPITSITAMSHLDLHVNAFCWSECHTWCELLSAARRWGCNSHDSASVVIKMQQRLWREDACFKARGRSSFVVVSFHLLVVVVDE